MAYNASRVLELSGPVDVPALQSSLDGIVARFEVLRTRITEVDGDPVPVLGQAGTVELEVLSLADVDRDFDDLVRAFVNRPFDLARDQLLRGLLLRFDGDRSVLVLCVHHIASDGTSRQILMDELRKGYLEAVSGVEPTDKEPPELQFSDVAAWQRATIEDPKTAEHSSFWARYLAEAPDVIQLPLDHDRPQVQSFAGAQLTTTLDSSLVLSLEELARETAATPFVVLLAGFSVVVGRLAGQRDLLIGTPVNGRHLPELEAVMGMLSDTVPVRVVIDDELDFRDQVRRTMASFAEAFGHQHTPFDHIVKIARPQRDPSRAPLIQVLINDVGLRDNSVETWGELSVRPSWIDPHTSQVDLSLAISRTLDGAGALQTNLVWEWCTDLWDQVFISTISDCLTTFLTAAVSGPDTPLGRLPIVDAAEQRRLIGLSRGPKVPPPEWTVIDRLRHWATTTPQRPAVKAADGVLTYGELDEQSNLVAEVLAAHGVGRGDRVAICFERSVQLLVAIAGVMKAGAAYVPIEPSYPQRRIEDILGDAGVEVVLTTSDLVASTQIIGIQVMLDQLDGQTGLSTTQRPSVLRLPRPREHRAERSRIRHLHFGIHRSSQGSGHRARVADQSPGDDGRRSRAGTRGGHGRGHDAGLRPFRTRFVPSHGLGRHPGAGSCGGDP